MITQEITVERVRAGEFVNDQIAVAVAMSVGKMPKMVIMTNKGKRGEKAGIYKDVSEYRVGNLDLPKMSHGLGFVLNRDERDVKPGEPTHYHVFVAKKPEDDLCDCQGFFRHRRCKHTSAMRAIVADAE